MSGAELAKKYSGLGIEMPFPRSDNWYYYSDVEGWAKILPDLLIKSSLYSEDRYDCEDYAMKAQIVCAERYGLNTLRYTYGRAPQGTHGFNSLWTGDGFLLFEPNGGFDVEVVFPFGDNGYIPEKVLI